MHCTAVYSPNVSRATRSMPTSCPFQCGKSPHSHTSVYCAPAAFDSRNCRMNFSNRLPRSALFQAFSRMSFKNSSSVIFPVPRSLAETEKRPVMARTTTKKRVLESMPSPEALAQARLKNTERTRRYGAFLLHFQTSLWCRAFGAATGKMCEVFR